MISLYPPTALDWTTNGWITCQPTRCVVRETAGGSYELEMDHPLTADQRWTQIGIGYIIKAPVPMRQSPYIGAIHAEGKLIYKANGAVELYSKAARPSGVTMPSATWNRATTYEPGTRVKYMDVPYQCIKHIGPRTITVPIIGEVVIDTSGIRPPSEDTEHWKRLSRSNGSKTVVKLVAGDEVALLSEVNSNWFRAKTNDDRDIEGYANYADFTFDRKEDFEQGELEERVIRDQCFRIVRLETDSRAMNLRIYARHISYDYMGTVMDDVARVYDETVSTALVRIHDACTDWAESEELLPSGYFEPSILTDFTIETLTADWRWKNPIYALLDPNEGLVPILRAMCIRDNYDIFILKNRSAAASYQMYYGRNLVGVTWKRSSEDVITHVLPRGKNADGSLRLLSPPLIASADAAYWPVPNVEQIDVQDAEVGKEIKLPDGTTHTQTEQDVDDLLTSTGSARFDTDHADRQKLELTVDFVHLGDTEECRQYRGLEQLSLYDVVDIRHDIIGLAETAQVVEYEWDAVLERYNSIKLGDPFDYNFRQVAGFQLMPYSIDQTRLTPSLLAMITKDT